MRRNASLSMGYRDISKKKKAAYKENTKSYFSSNVIQTLVMKYRSIFVTDHHKAVSKTPIFQHS